MKSDLLCPRLLKWLWPLAVAASAYCQPVITEFMASNSRTLADQDGEFSDWIEIYNGGVDPLNLEGWFLTDSASDLDKWRFPRVMLPANSYLVVFASNKDRATAGSQLHSNFKLTADGEYLALVQPDAITKAWEYKPAFPVQVSDVSFGIPLRETVITLISSNAPARIAVPVDDFFGAAWTALDFDDGAWLPVINGVGYEADSQPPPPELVADSVADFSGTQGQNNWFYGYYNKTTDLGGRYQTNDFIAFPNDEGPHSPYNFWNGASWKWYDGNPPFDEIGERYMHPNGANNAQEHWTIRRWRCKASGTISIEWQLAKQAAGGTGVTARVFYNGTQKDIATIAGNDVTGVTRSLEITGVQPGDFIDIALAAAGTGTSTDDKGDGTLLSVKIRALASLANQISTPIDMAMRGFNASAYLRFPFAVTDPSAFEFLTLRMKYDAGFIAYLNGFEVASANAPAAPAWNSSATAARLDSEAIHFEEFNLSGFLSLLQVGTNVLAIHGLNENATDADFLILPELQAISQTADPTSQRYFSAPTPGRINGFGNTNLGPLILEAAHTPSLPMDNEDLSVTGRVAPTFNAVNKVTLIYRVMYGVEASISMSDDGMHGDGLTGDGLYGGYIPAGASTPGQMVRYALTASDSKGNTSRWPLYPDPKNSPQYLGTMVANPAVTSALPVLHWFIQNPSAADNSAGSRSSIFYDGEFYDNILVYAHGQSSLGFPKKSYNFDMNSGYRLRYAPDQPRIHDINLLTTYPDKAHMRNMLSYETYRNAGSPYHFAFAVRVQRNATFFSDAHFVENGDDVFLERLGLDTRGALYKMYNTLDSATTGVEKKTRKSENNSDLQALINGTKLTGAARARYLYDNVNIPEMINYLAAMVITGGIDCCHKNYYAYRDTEGTGEWQYLPWDVDLTFGRNWNSAQTYFDDALHPDAPLYIGGNNALPAALFATPALKQMYQRRVRTLMDQLLQPPGTPLEQLKFERRIDELYTQIAPDAALDFAKWASWGQRQTLTQAVSLLKAQYLPARRTYLYNLAPPRGKEVPTAQPTNSFIKFSAIDFNPASGRQSQEYIQLFNTNSYAVDISRWQLAGAVQHVFQGGGVIPTNSALYVSPDVVAFRARTNGPGGSQSLFVQGNYRGQLSARGETVHLLDDSGRLVNSITYAGNPSAAQLYLRVTEIMYHPAPPPIGSPFDQEDFEYLELKNIGPVALDLRGVHFVGGIDFDFTGSNVTNLDAGQTVLLTKNQAAFAARYGSGFHIAGTYSGNLENNGENLRLEDAMGEKVLEFDYNNSWDPVTDGQGFALVIVDESAPWDTWNAKASWRRSARLGGSPGLTDPALTPIPGILINEILTHTDPPLLDAIECFNPATNEVNIGGWFLTDDRSLPKKFRIPSDTTIAGNGYRVFTEADFNTNSGVDPSFSLSSHGEEVFLFSADNAGNLTGYSDGFRFDAAANGVSFGRYASSTGEILYPPQETNTFGSVNAGPRVGPVVISEIQYHPAPGGDEFIELKNTSNDAIRLYDPVHPTNTWKLNGAAFTFPANVQIPAHGLLVVAGTDPVAFRAKHNLPADVVVLGPYSGALQDNGEFQQLQQPDAPDIDTNGVAFVPYVTVDEVRYGNLSPWPTNAAGSGPSLERINLRSYGNDPINWRPSPAGASPGQDTLLSWKADYFTAAELANASISGDQADPDRDGQTNLREFMSGTNPRDAQSVVRIESIEWTAGSNIEIRIRFQAVAGKSYSVQYTESFDAGIWLRLRDSEAQPATRIVEVTDSIAGHKSRYYRVVTPRQP